MNGTICNTRINSNRCNINRRPVCQYIWRRSSIATIRCDRMHCFDSIYHAKNRK